MEKQINKLSPELLRLECYKIVEGYVVPTAYYRKGREVTDEQMDDIFAKAERVYQYITQGKSVSQELQSDDHKGLSKETRQAYYYWLDYEYVACRKPIEVIKNKLTVPAGFIFKVKDVNVNMYTDNRLITVALTVSVERDDGTSNDRVIFINRTAEELNLEFYDCPETPPSKVIEHKSDTPKVFSDGRKVYQYTYEVIE